jgi:putative transposase
VLKLGGFAQTRQAAQLGYIHFIRAGKGQPSPWEQLKNQIFLGDDAFVEDMQCKIDPEQSLLDIPKKQKLAPIKPLQ